VDAYDKELFEAKEAKEAKGSKEGKEGRMEITGLVSSNA
jgi:hypothetical protein